MIALIVSSLAAPQDEEVLDELELDRTSHETETPTPKNRGRLAMVAGPSRWKHPATSLSGALQVHLGRWVAIHLEGGAHRLMTLRGSQRTIVYLPDVALGLVFDPVAESRLKPQLGLDLVAQIIHLDRAERRLFGSGGPRGRFGLDLQVVGALHLCAEGYVGGQFVQPSFAEYLNPRWAGMSAQYGARAGWGMRW